MKRFLLLIILASCFSCATAQKIEPLPVYRTNAYVHTVYGEVTTLQPADSRISYEIPTNPNLVADKEYTFWLEYVEVAGRKIKAVVVAYAITTAQAQRDQKAEADRLSKRLIIRN